MKDKIRKVIQKTYSSGLHTEVHELTSKVINLLGLSDEWANYVDIEVRNIMNKEPFNKTPIEERVLFLPHCLRDAESCEGEYGEKGLICHKCGRCDIMDIVEYAKNLGYKGVYIVPGGSIVYNIMSQNKPRGIIGVACYEELNQAMKKAREEGIPSQGILLTKAGCINTKVEKAEIARKLKK